MVDRVEVPSEEGLQTNAGQKPDNTQTVQEATGERPSWLPENFKSVEDFVQSHNDLRADHTRKSQELAELKKPGEAEGGDKSVTDGQQEGEQPNPEADKDGEEKSGEKLLPGVDNARVEAISAHAWENGEITEEHYVELAKSGYSRDVVDRYMEGQFAAHNGSQEAILNAGGGAENVQSMFDWAEANLSRDVVDNYNAKFAAGGADALMAMEHLQGRYQDSGVAPGGSTIKGGNAPSGETSTYQSIAQMSADMADPKYAHDPAFRKMVADKLGRSSIL